MFKQARSDTGYDWPVSVHVPQSGGTWSHHKFTAQFKRLTKTEAKAVVEKLGTEKDDGEDFEVLDLVAQIMTGWGAEVIDAEDKPIVFSETELRKLCDLFPQAIGAIFDAWTESMTKGKEKNFKRPRGTG